MISYKEKLNKVTTFMFDVDGVLTNGDVMLLHNDVVRTLNSRDAYALQYAVKMGFNVLIVTGGNSQDVKDRLLALGVQEVHLSSFNKLNVYNEIKARLGLVDEEILYMGDDIPDYQVMQRAGVAACPQDAAVEIKHISDYQSPFNGGRHCVRDIIEQTLRVQEKWFSESAFEW
ncbi:MAG: KdsC family phosphatase [Flavobacteriia bacterium]|jgi:3-deoxy-D-manno-octulosonate 8-phosphate phosphatase (KDO 8-P phosphatase)